MELADRIAEDIRSAMRAGDAARRDLLRLARNNLLNEEKSNGRPLEESDAVQVLQRQARRHKESIEEFRKGNRMDLVEKESAELCILEEYLPALMSRETVIERARIVIQETSAAGPGDKGKVMGRLMPQIQGQADGNLVNQVVTEMLEAL
jgi:uncharacterized protein YqeY